MKKVLSVLMVLILMVSILASCKAKDVTADPTPTPNVATEGIVKLGLGSQTTIAKSKSMAGDVLALAQVDTVIAAVAFDKDNKVVKVVIDSAQSRVNFDKDLKLSSNLTAVQKTKVELGDDYKMINNSKIKKEWYQQIAELEKWMVGKTVAEIKAMKVKDSSVPDVAELTSLVTISVQDYIAVVEKAYNNAVAVQSGAQKIGLGTSVSIAKSKSLDGSVLPLAQVDTVMTATAFDNDNKVVGVSIDTAQTRVQFDKDGKITSDLTASYKTKVELGDDYKMINNSKIKKEWYQQIAELEKWMVGKTVAEIKAMKVKDASVPDVAELTSLVTISVQDYIAVVEKASINAK